MPNCRGRKIEESAMRKMIWFAFLGTVIATPFSANAVERLHSSTEFQRIILAQAGSAGGTIGKQDKSISGGEEGMERDRPPQANPGRPTSRESNTNDALPS